MLKVEKMKELLEAYKEKLEWYHDAPRRYADLPEDDEAIQSLETRIALLSDLLEWCV